MQIRVVLALKINLNMTTRFAEHRIRKRLERHQVHLSTGWIPCYFSPFILLFDEANDKFFSHLTERDSKSWKEGKKKERTAGESASLEKGLLLPASFFRQPHADDAAATGGPRAERTLVSGPGATAGNKNPSVCVSFLPSVCEWELNATGLPHIHTSSGARAAVVSRCFIVARRKGEHLADFARSKSLSGFGFRCTSCEQRNREHLPT